MIHINIELGPLQLEADLFSGDSYGKYVHVIGSMLSLRVSSKRWLHLGFLLDNCAYGILGTGPYDLMLAFGPQWNFTLPKWTTRKLWTT